MASDASGDRLQALGMFASALAGRPVAVAELQPGALAWTDGQTIFVDAAARARAKLDAIAVQASLITAGSLDPEVVRSLVRQPRLFIGQRLKGSNRLRELLELHSAKSFAELGVGQQRRFGPLFGKSL